MIFINRNRLKKPKCLNLKNRKSAASLEFNNNKNAKNNKKKLKFSVYKNKEVVAALRKLFRNKCAYCESEMNHVSDDQIEHFRPKGRVRPSINNPKYNEDGYFWLGAEWNNLFLSCLRCNQIRIDENGISKGKGDFFPIEGGKRIHKSYKDRNFKKEEKMRLLINPCFDKPEKYLKFCIDDKDSKFGLIEHKSKKGEVSIKLYNLNKPSLVLKRQREIGKLKLQLNSIEPSITKIKNIKNKLEFIKNIMISIQKLHMIEYLAFKIQLVEEFRKFCKNQIKSKKVRIHLLKKI